MLILLLFQSDILSSRIFTLNFYLLSATTLIRTLIQNPLSITAPQKLEMGAAPSSHRDYHHHKYQDRLPQKPSRNYFSRPMSQEQTDRPGQDRGGEERGGEFAPARQREVQRGEGGNYNNPRLGGGIFPVVAPALNHGLERRPRPRPRS